MNDIEPEWVEAGARAFGGGDNVDRDIVAVIIAAVAPLIRADERQRTAEQWNEGSVELYERLADLRAQVEALRDAARVDRNAAPPGSQSWILNAGRATAYADLLALLGGDS